MKVFLFAFLWALVGMKVCAQQIHSEHVLFNDSVVANGDVRSTYISSSDTIGIFHLNESSGCKSADSLVIASTSFYAGTDNHLRQVAGYHTKSPVLAGVFSALIPGLGQVYEGDVCKGVTYMVATYGLEACALGSIINKSVATGIFNSCAAFGFYIWNIVNAVTSANQLNHKNSMVNIPLGNKTLGFTPRIDCLHTCNGQYLFKTANAGIKLSYSVSEKSR